MNIENALTDAYVEIINLKNKISELEKALAKPAWERQFHWSKHVPGNCEVCNRDQDGELCYDHVCPGCAEQMRGLEYAHDQIKAQRDRFRDALNIIASWDEGHEVNSSFDEPGSAAMARQALKETP